MVTLPQNQTGDNQLQNLSQLRFKLNYLKKELLGAIGCCERSTDYERSCGRSTVRSDRPQDVKSVLYVYD
ncbi:MULTISPECIES: hypothetical protein [unclassified Microcoleus]|uniref:hypothetical protein n=1 Tax=unclassified Microcoleus TaxID=2642155 RepID=UPI002FD41A79